jgi:uncharacterized protein with ParB-like and HNH nuclease domain
MTEKLDITVSPQPITLYNVFSNSTFKVPKYQRNYKWNETNWEQLIESIENNQHNFLGTLFYLHKTNDVYAPLEIIDGQQRITTFMILIKALELSIEKQFKTLKEPNEDAKKNKKTIVQILHQCRYNTQWGNPKQRLELQDLNKAKDEFDEIMNLEGITFNKLMFTQKISDSNELIEGLSLDKKYYSKDEVEKIKEVDKLISETRKDITKIKDELKTYSLEFKLKNDTQKNINNAFYYLIKSLEDKKLEELYKFKDNLLQNQFFIEMKTGNQDSVYEYFKCLNATGVSLSIADILKNNLFKYLPKEKKESDEVIKEFEKIITTVEEHKSLKLDEFLLHSANARLNVTAILGKLDIKDKTISARNLLSVYTIILKEHDNKSNSGSKNLVAELTRDLEHYLKIVLPSKHLKTTDNEFYFYNLLQKIAPKKAIAFLIASYNSKTDKERIELGKLVTYVVVRHTIMPNRDMKTLSGIFTKAIQALSSPGIAKVKIVFEESQAYSVDKSKITADIFATFGWSNAQALALNAMIYSNEIKEAPKFIDTFDNLSAEHIMPQTPNLTTKKYWHTAKILDIDSKAISDEEIYKQYVSQIGNFIILHTKDNSSLGNKTFTDKKRIYKLYPFKHIQTIGNKQKWSQKEIKKRSNDLYKKFELLRNI